MTGPPLFDSKPIQNVFYLHAATFEIAKERFIIKLPNCCGTDFSVEIYQLLLLFSNISPWYYRCYHFAAKVTCGYLPFLSLSKPFIKWKRPLFWCFSEKQLYCLKICSDHAFHDQFLVFRPRFSYLTVYFYCF